MSGYIFNISLTKHFNIFNIHFEDFKLIKMGKHSQFNE